MGKVRGVPLANDFVHGYRLENGGDIKSSGYFVIPGEHFFDKLSTSYFSRLLKNGYFLRRAERDSTTCQTLTTHLHNKKPALLTQRGFLTGN